SQVQNSQHMSYWRRWVSQPQSVWLRKAIFQIHLWSGIGVGLYVLMISVTGSIVVYSNELYRAATPDPVNVSPSGPRVTEDHLQAAATRKYPGYAAAGISGGLKPDQAITITFSGPRGRMDRLFNPYTGEDLGDAVPFRIRFVSKLLELHDDLLTGPTGRKVNGAGALLLIVMSSTGIVVWWPGIKTWRRSLTIHR